MTKKKILLVEGPDDQQVVYHLLNHYGLGHLTESKQIEVMKECGVEKLLNRIPIRINNDQNQHIGFILDADVSVDQRWQAFKNRLADLKAIDMPKRPQPKGTVFKLQRADDTIVTIGLWIMPNNQESGRLENFIQHLVPTENKLWDYAQTCVENIPAYPFDFERKDSLGQASWQQKAQLHSWLAWQEEPGCPMGLAINKTFLKASVPEAEQFITWFKQLFQVEEETECTTPH